MSDVSVSDVSKIARWRKKEGRKKKKKKKKKWGGGFFKIRQPR